MVSNKNELIKRPLCAAITAFLFALASSVALAQDTTDENKDQADAKAGEPAAQTEATKSEEHELVLEEVVVTGIRQSAFAQRENKRLSDNVTDSIFAEDMGRMPDQNVAEAMQRITGIGIDRSDGEGTFVTVRGVDPNLNIVTMNGQTITSGGDGNAFDFSILSADILRSIEVIKTPSANQIEGSLGGTVNLKTFRPLDMKSRRLSFELQAKRNDLADKTDPSAKFAYANKFSDDRFGFSVSAYYDQQSIRKDQFTTFDRFSVKNMPGTSLQSGEDLGDVWTTIPDFMEYVVNETERSRYGAAASLDFRPDDKTDLWLDLTFSNLTVETDEHHIRLNRMHRNSAKNQNPGKPISGTWIIDEGSNSAVAGTSANTSGNHLSRQIETETKTSVVGIGASRKMGEWLGTIEAGFSRADQSWPLNRRLNFLVQGNPQIEASYNWLDDDGNFFLMPTMEFESIRDPLDPTVLVLNQLWSDDREVTDDLNSFQIDMERDVDWGPFKGIEFGARYFDRTKDRSQTTGFAAPDNPSGEAIHLTDPGIGTDFPVNDFFSGIADNVIKEWLVPDFDLVYDTYYPEGYEVPLDNINTYVVKQDSTAGYVKADWSFMDDRLAGDIGVRYVKTNNRSTGHQGINYPKGEGSAELPVDIKNSYSNTLPSLNSRFLINEDMLLRFAVAKVMARPSFNELRPGIVIRATNANATPTATGGNPALDPTQATQFDLSWEWYFGETGLLSAALFYKDIDTFIFNQTQIRTNVPDPLYSSNGLLLDGGTCLTADKYDANTCDVADVPFTIPLNGVGGTIQGLELSYQQNYTSLPGWMSGLGTILNYTYTDSEATFYTEDGNDAYDSFPFPNTSKNTANATVYWQQGGHSIRLAYNYRSGRLISPAVLTSSIWADSRDSLDFSANFQLSKVFVLSLQAINLTDEYDRTYATRTVSSKDLPSEGNALDGDAPKWRTSGLVHSGRIFRIGLRAIF